MKGMTGRSGTCNLPFLIVIFSPAAADRIAFAKISLLPGEPFLCPVFHKRPGEAICRPAPQCRRERTAD
jgi:hypothetical protein